jgi:O-antigen ligase
VNTTEEVRIDNRTGIWLALSLLVLTPVAIGLLIGWDYAFIGLFIAGLLAAFAVAMTFPAAAFWMLVTLVVLAPLPLGAVHTWSWGFMACIVGALLAAWSLRVVLGWERVAIGLKTMWPFVLLFAGCLAWGVIQSLSTTPDQWQHPLWSSAADAIGMTLDGYISLNPYETISIMCRLLTYGGVFWLSLQYCRKGDRARQVVFAVTYSGLIYTVYGLIVHFSGSQTILWFNKFAYLEDLTSSFINRNSFATYAGLVLICASGLIVMLFASSTRSTLSSTERIRQLIEKIAERGWPLLVAWIVVITALILSHSRAGFVSTLLGLAALVAALGIARGLPGRYAAGFGAVCILLLGLFLTVGGDVLEQRMVKKSVLDEPRLRVYELTLSAIDSAPLLGTGAGTFEEVFRFYRTNDIKEFFMKAHSTYLENVLEMGIPAALALFAVFGGFLILTYLGLRRRRRDFIYPCIGFASTVLVAAHSAVDFSLQIPAVTVTYSLIMGASCAQCWNSRRANDPW